MAGLTESQIAVLRAVIDRIVPQDGDPAGTGFGADRYVLAQLRGGLAAEAPAIASGLDTLGPRFTSLDDAAQDAALGAVEAQPWFARLVMLTQEGVYADPDNGGNIDAASWRMIGYEPRLPDGITGPRVQPQRPPRALGASEVTDYDVIIVGAGAGGGVMACKLAEGGKSVLLLERGREQDYPHDGHRDHLRNHRLAEYGHNTGPALEGNPRVFVDLDGTEHVIAPHHGDYQNNAAGVGSGTVVYGAQAWRFHPDDFRMASRYGVPEGSSLADWPISYADVAPYYDWIEWEIGVAGDGAQHRGGPRARNYPMPPVPQYRRGELLTHGGAALGIDTLSPPLLINTIPLHGRGACIECGSCVGFPCPSNAKNGTQNTMIPRALATGRATLVTGAMVDRVEADANGVVSGVSYWAEQEKDTPVRKTARAKTVVLSASAIETARLLLASGLGNEHVGRNLQGHYYPTVFGRFDEDVHTSRGPGVSIATTSYNHGNDGVIGGSMLADEFVVLPVIFYKQALPPGLKPWGAAAKSYMRDEYRRVAKVTGPVQEIPSAEARVTLADITDRFGMRVARLSGATHAETVRTADFMRQRALEWLSASGARQTWSKPPRQKLSGGQHQAGTCRMGTSPENSATDVFGRVWGHDNLFVADGSLHVTNGGFNPVLTIMALAARNADHILATA